MRSVDWLVVVIYVTWIIVDGLRRSKATDKVDGYLLANRSLPWWRSASRDGDADERGHDRQPPRASDISPACRFVQFYFGLPLAMIILSLTVVPFFTRARVYTAYEYLERRFDAPTRSLASFLFLIGRAASLA